MTDQEFELKKWLKNSDALPSRESLTHALSALSTSDVTGRDAVRYTRETASPSHITHNAYTRFMAIWKTKWIVLVPSLIILFIVTIPLSLHTASAHNKAILKLAVEDGSIDEAEVVDNDDAVLLTSFNDQAIDELSSIQKDEF